jgi:predicted type IV restriction endonuclease
VKKLKQRDLIAKDLRTPKYRMRVVPLATAYNRKKEQNKFLKELKDDEIRNV